MQMMINTFFLLLTCTSARFRFPLFSQPKSCQTRPVDKSRTKPAACTPISRPNHRLPPAALIESHRNPDTAHHRRHFGSGRRAAENGDAVTCPTPMKNSPSVARRRSFKTIERFTRRQIRNSASRTCVHHPPVIQPQSTRIPG